MAATERNAQGVDVLSLVKGQTAHYVALAQSDAYAAQEAPKWMAASIAIGELMEAGSAIRARVPAEWLEGMAAGRMPPGDGLFVKWQDVARLAAALLPFQSEAGR